MVRKEESGRSVKTVGVQHNGEQWKRCPIDLYWVWWGGPLFKTFQPTIKGFPPQPKSDYSK